MPLHIDQSNTTIAPITDPETVSGASYYTVSPSRNLQIPAPAKRLHAV
jgi:hypothetical protein